MDWPHASPLSCTLVGGQSCRMTAGLDAGDLSPGLDRGDPVVENDAVPAF